MTLETNSKIGLISKALVLVGEKPLNSLSDDRYGATVGANLFELLYESELASNRWRFTCNKKALSQLVNVPLNEWAFAYQLPSDMLLPIGIFPYTSYEIYANHLYTDQSSVEFDYQFKPEVSACPSYFCQLMVYALARDMVKPITESENAVETFMRKYVLQRDRALYADAQGRPNRSVANSPFTDARG